MLAVQKIRIYWNKENRTPDRAAVRRRYLKPAVLSEKAVLQGDGIFVNELDYIQMDKMYLSSDYYIENGNRIVNSCFKAESIKNEIKRKHILEMRRLAERNEGSFYLSGKDVNIAGIIITEEHGSYRIKHHSLENGYKPVRTGYNEDFYDEASEFCGRNICCRTAFVLEKGESGKVEFNYRFSDEGGQHYEHYCIYFLNTDSLHRRAFVQAEYHKQCIELAHLF